MKKERFANHSHTFKVYTGLAAHQENAPDIKAGFSLSPPIHPSLLQYIFSPHPSPPSFLPEWLMDTFGNNCPCSAASRLYTTDGILTVGYSFSYMSETSKLTVDYTRQTFLSMWKNLEWYNLSLLLICNRLKTNCNL